MRYTFSSLEGKILIASPKLEDHIFKKSIIYIFMHDQNGALGIILNHKIGYISNHELLSLFNKSVNKVRVEKLPIVFGGPINTERMIALSTSNHNSRQFNSLQSIILHTNIYNFIENCIIKGSKSKFLLARGVSAWDATQLEEEIAENTWFIIQKEVDLIFSHKIKDKWLLIATKLGINNANFIVPYSGNA